MQYKSELTSEDGERYYTGTDNEQYVSVTTLLKKYEDSSALAKWKARVGDEEADRISLESRTLGTHCHTEIEEFQHLLSAGKITPETTANFQKYSLLAIENFYAHINTISAEEVLFYKNNDGIRYAGRYDTLATVPGNKFYLKRDHGFVPEGKYIVDLKTKRRPPRLDIPDYNLKHFLQLSAYWAVLNQTQDISGAIVVFVTDKKCNLLYLDSNDMKFYWEIFYRLCLDFYKVRKERCSWKDFCQSATYRYDVESNDCVSNLPREICLSLETK